MKKLALSDEILLQVDKPARYIGNEVNMIVKDPKKVDIRLAMCFPDVYEIGMSHLGIQILYDMFNRREDTYCERVYSPWLDLDKIMREKDIPLFAIESQEPIKNFDFLGITLQYEMCYTNILQILDLSKIPLIGEAFFNCDFLTYLIYILLIFTWIFYKKTTPGLAFAAVGEHPQAAESAGIPVKKYRWVVMVFNGLLGEIGGAYLVLVQLGVFTENMISGRGYIALATVILGRYTPFGMFGAALLFGAANALQIRLQTIGVSISPFLLAILPYALTLIAMLGAAGKSSEPEALSKPYIKGSR